MAAPRFQNEDEAAQHYLSVLREGSRAEKIEARAGLAGIFAVRGLFEEAAELYELNIRAGVRTPELFEQLSGVYRELGDAGSADAALEEGQRLRRSAARSSTPPAPDARGLDSFDRDSYDRDSYAGVPDDRTSGATVRPSGPEPNGRSGPAAAEQAAPVRGAQLGGSGNLLPRTPASPVSADDFAAGARPAPAASSQSPAPASPTERVPAVTARLQAPWANSEVADPSAADLHAETRRTAVQRGGRMGSLPTPVLVPTIVLFMIVLPVALLAILVVNPLALYLEGKAAGPTVEASQTGAAAQSPAQLKVAPGASSSWYLQAGRSVSGLWATPGLELTLDQDVEGVGKTFMVTGPRPQAWGETITIVERRGQGRSNQATTVPATFEAPRSLPASGTVLTGHIAGQVTAPRLSESSQFNTSTENINLPVQLVVVSTPALWLDRFVNAFTMYFDEDRWLLVTIGALLAWCIMAGAIAIIFRVGQR